MRRFVAAAAAVALAISAVPISASPVRETAVRAVTSDREHARAARVSLVDSGRRIAARMAAAQQPDSCAAAATAGARDGNQRQGRAGWFFGGFFLPVIMPIVAHVSTPQPPADTVLQYSGDDARCYAASYSDAAATKRKQGAWIGSVTTVVLIAVAVATAEPAY